ncbi:MAG: pilus assembly protein TadG-related protein [Chloroflexota bacterium]|nr:pilus assembly protein TadG-related protein [Chloroflexota bacterium]
MTDRNELGQVLPITALFMTSLLLIAALAIDVAGVLSAERFYTTTADAAALAGGQDLQQATSRLVTDTERGKARDHAMTVLVDRLGATSTPSAGTCGTTNDVLNCALPGTPYLVSIETPSPSCVNCEPLRSLQVTIRNPSYGLTFAALVGQADWNVEATAVAGLQFVGKYAVQTLRPPHPLPNSIDQNRENISVDGTNTWVSVPRGDIGTNTSAFTNSGGTITLATGFRIDHIDDITPDPWNQVAGLPEGFLLRKLIPDPDYMVADFGGAPTYSDQADGRWDAVAGNGPDPCPVAGTEGFPPDYKAILEDPSLDVTCYLPGVYMDAQGFNVPQNTDVAYLLPGAYYFGSKGLDVGGTLMGGLVRDANGVVLVVPQDADFSGNNAVAIMLNQGDETCMADSCRSLPAIDWAGQEVKSSEGLLLTIEVPRDEQCFSGTTPLDVGACTTGNSTINLPGNGNLAVTGVVYAPSDNAQINGNNTNQVGEVGQLIAWTVKYGGGAKLNQIYPEPDQVGIVRLDAACTGLEVCNRP